MTRAAVRAPGGPFYVVFDGQSLNLNNYPQETMSGLGVPWANVAISGYTWTQLTNGVNPGEAAVDRLFPLANLADTTILIMNGGTMHINSGDSAATYFAAEETYADAARAAGFNIIINTTLAPSSTFNQSSGNENDQRLAANTLKLADTNNKFEACVDFASDSQLGDLVWANPPNASSWSSASGSYADGTHWTTAGASRAALLMRTALVSLLV